MFLANNRVINEFASSYRSVEEVHAEWPRDIMYGKGVDSYWAWDKFYVENCSLSLNLVYVYGSYVSPYAM